ncbi:MAG: anti-sigma factor [Desulfuromonadales bacterium C00003068]|jgi:serine/threonine-protein kinase RsbW|nr:MAG: anti-sigma factor [Desulfuromonadales bacterium C00003068]
MENQLEMDIKVPNQTRYLGLIGKIGEDIAYTLKNFKDNRDELAYHINLVLTEAMANAIKHANQNDPNKEVHITINVSQNNLCIKVYDQGQGFDIRDVNIIEPDPTKDHGRGVFLIHSLMDSVSYTRCEHGHVLEMNKSFELDINP